MRGAFLALIGFSFGALSAAGVFTVLAAVGLVPRFVGKTRTAKDVTVYENMIVLGTIIGGVYSIYPNRILVWKEHLCQPFRAFMGSPVATTVELGFLVFVGVFSGMFVGCLALAIAEILDSIPIFTRRVRLHKGIGVLVFGIAVGKFAGALLYFWMERLGW